MKQGYLKKIEYDYSAILADLKELEKKPDQNKKAISAKVKEISAIEPILSIAKIADRAGLTADQLKDLAKNC